MTPHTYSPNKSLPTRLRAGDQHAWNVATDLPAGTVLFYVLTAIIANAPVRFTLGGNGAATTANGITTYAGVAVDSTGLAAFSVASAASAAWLAGRYDWVLFAVDTTGNRTQLGVGNVRVTPDPNAATPIDTRSWNEKLLAAITDLLAGRALDDSVMYKIGNRELTKLDPLQLEKWRGIVAARVRRERIRAGKFVPTNTLDVTFGGR